VEQRHQLGGQGAGVRFDDLLGRQLHREIHFGTEQAQPVTQHCGGGERPGISSLVAPDYPERHQPGQLVVVEDAPGARIELGPADGLWLLRQPWREQRAVQGEVLR
jgi:hypothetical protein